MCSSQVTNKSASNLKDTNNIDDRIMRIRSSAEWLVTPELDIKGTKRDEKEVMKVWNLSYMCGHWSPIRDKR